MAERCPLSVTLYLALSRLAGPVLRLLHAYRCKSGKDDPARGEEKFGISGVVRPKGHLVWIHAASVGETASVLSLISRLQARGYTVLLTTVTRTSASLAQQQLPNGAIHQYAPYDSLSCWERFLEHWQPDLALCVESEIWPASFVALARRGVPLCIVNGRMSEKSFNGWSQVKTASRYLFGLPELVLAQSAADAKRFSALGCTRVETPGNLKFDAAPDAPSRGELSGFRATIGNRPRWLAALTHPGEDAIALDAHQRLLEDTPDLLLMLVPRHPARGEDISRLAADKGFAVLRRTQNLPVPADAQVYVGDTLGEMNLFYSAADVCFLGGSFVEVGGHNPVEAASFETALISGPKVANARPVYRALWETGGAVRVSEPRLLAAEVRRLLDDAVARKEQTSAAAAVIAEGRGALDRTLDFLSPYLAPSRSGERET
ncbi:3-deoxy-D-manno-octulosonic acid transferase [Roseibium sp.]|uniref:3-deoxy-D-manno-octulosonic acid transferase n=1 Tax=Roseibium sp. TaxID=1936156 RepID=UPI003A96C22B